MSIIIITDGRETDGPGSSQAAITALLQLSAAILHRVRSLTETMATQADLNAVADKILMKQSEANELTRKAAARANEAFTEISKKIDAQQKKIDQLIADAKDPEVTDQEFLTSLNDLKRATDQLADIVPDATPTTGTPETDPQMSNPNAPLVPPSPTDVRPDASS